MADTPTLPTAEDLARDAVADMAMCDAATPGPWVWDGRFGANWELFTAHSGSLAVLCAGEIEPTGPDDLILHGAQLEVREDNPCRLVPLTPQHPDAAFLPLARAALPAWIRRAVAAEARVKALEDALRPFAAVGDLADEIGYAHEMNVADMPSDTAPLVGECINAKEVLNA